MATNKQKNCCQSNRYKNTTYEQKKKCMAVQYIFFSLLFFRFKEIIMTMKRNDIHLNNQ